jgi:hypothetical protein
MENQKNEGLAGQPEPIVSGKVPALCLKSYNPYTYCPLAFRHEDEMILSYVHSLVVEIRRLNGLPMSICGHDAQAIDRYCSEITAYMNGRIHGLA